MARKKSSLSKALQNAQSQDRKNRQTAKIQQRQQNPTRKEQQRHPASADLPKTPLSVLHPRDKVLLIGEGNFSFAATLIIEHLHPGKLITASTIDSKETVLEKYPDAEEYLRILEEHEATILFDLDGCKLDEDKRMKKIVRSGQGRFDKVIFNFPHVGGSEADQDRSVRANQVLVLRFLRSVPGCLFQPDPEASTMLLPRKKKRRKAPTDGSNKFDPNHPTRENSFDSASSHCQLSDPELDSNHSIRKPGSVLITAGTGLPYSLWDVPKLAKNGRTLAHSILYPSHPVLRLKGDQPSYKLLRSFAFDRWIEGRHTNSQDSSRPILYQHRQTNGLKDLVKDSRPSSPRTWEFQLVS